MVTESQTNDGYRCSCGEVFKTKKDFTSHLLRAARQDGKGAHRSEGRVNLETGEITMPPWDQRTDEQKESSTYAQKRDAPKKGSKTPREPKEAIRPTDILAQAQQLKVIPRVYTIDYSPVMRAAQEATVRLWGWPEMGLGDLIDTIFHMFFDGKGITLAGYIVHETEEERIEREAMIAKMISEREKQEVVDGS